MLNSVNKLRQAYQEKALKAWIKAGRVGSVIAATGFGKSKVALDALCLPIRENPEHVSLLLVPTVDLQQQFKRTAKSFGYEEEFSKVRVHCFASGHKLKPDHYDTVVVDEVHLSFGPKFSEFYANNSWDDLLCLTATVPDDEELRKQLFEIAPPVFTLGLDECVSLGLVSPYDIVAIPVHFTEKEAAKYADYNLKYEQAKAILPRGNTLSLAKAISGNPDAPMELKKAAWNAMSAIRGRAGLINNAENKLSAAEFIFQLFSDKDVKIMSFAESNDQTNTLAKLIGTDMAHAYHSGFTKQHREVILNRFKKGEFQMLCTTKVANQGISIDDASVGIILGLTSKSLTLIQRVGRLLRAQKDKRALIVILYVPNSREEVWLDSASKDLKVEYLENVLELEHFLNFT